MREREKEREREGGESHFPNAEKRLSKMLLGISDFFRSFEKGKLVFRVTPVISHLLRCCTRPSLSVPYLNLFCICLSLFMSLYISVSLYISLSFCICVYLYMCLYLCLFLFASV